LCALVCYNGRRFYHKPLGMSSTFDRERANCLRRSVIQRPGAPIIVGKRCYVKTFLLLGQKKFVLVCVRPLTHPGIIQQKGCHVKHFFARFVTRRQTGGAEYETYQCKSQAFFGPKV